MKPTYALFDFEKGQQSDQPLVLNGDWRPREDMLESNGKTTPIRNYGSNGPIGLRYPGES